jgi:hypothetical protein
MFKVESLKGNYYMGCRWLSLLGLIGLSPSRKKEKVKRAMVTKRKS